MTEQRNRRPDEAGPEGWVRDPASPEEPTDDTEGNYLQWAGPRLEGDVASRLGRKPSSSAAADSQPGAAHSPVGGYGDPAPQKPDKTGTGPERGFKGS
jgi:hypothetical protein